MEGGNEEWETAIQSLSAVGNETLHRIGPGAEEKEQIWEKQHMVWQEEICIHILNQIGTS